MGKRLPTTPRSRVRSALRQVWLRSRERAACLKAAGNRCARCTAKSSKAKGREVSIEVHHITPIDVWAEVLELVYRRILCDPSQMVCLCRSCHAKIHGEDG